MVTVETSAIEVAYLSFIVAIITLIASNVVQIWLSFQETKRHREQLKSNQYMERIRAEEERNRISYEKALSEKHLHMQHVYTAYAELVALAFQSKPGMDIHNFYIKLNQLLALLPADSAAHDAARSLLAVMESRMFPGSDTPAFPWEEIADKIQWLGDGIAELSALPLDP